MACATVERPSLPAFEAELAANESATMVLQDWCRDHRLAEPAAIHAEQIIGENVPQSDARRLLQVGDREPLHYRHVQLLCGKVVMSVAQNWFVPARLRPDMNRILDESDAPFGPVVKPLGFTRERLGVHHGDDPACPADTALSHHALLRLRNGMPFALVVECYPAELFEHAERK